MAVCDHGFYYGKAHKLFNRAAKRVCFAFDPFEQKEHVKEENYDEYLPFSKFLPSCRSTVFCEDYRNPRETPKCQQLSPDNFWEYLYSSAWGEGCSLRVMDGELLVLLLHCMFRMERDDVVLSQTHSAYVKNRRPARGCLQVEKSQDINYFTEILLIELTLYGNKPRRDNLSSEDCLIPEVTDSSRFRPESQQRLIDYISLNNNPKGVKFPDEVKRPTTIPPITIPPKLTAEYRSNPTINKRSLETVLRYNVRHFNTRHRTSVSLPVDVQEDVPFPVARAFSLDLNQIAQARWALEHLTEESLSLARPLDSSPHNGKLRQTATYPSLNKNQYLPSLCKGSNVSSKRQGANVTKSRTKSNAPKSRKISNLHKQDQEPILENLHLNPIVPNTRHNPSRCRLRQATIPQDSKSNNSVYEESSEEFPNLSCFSKKVERLTGQTDIPKDTQKIEDDLDKWLSRDFNYPKKPVKYKFKEEIVVTKFPKSTKKILQEKKKQRLLEADTKRREYEEAKAELEKSRPRVRPIEDVPAESFPLIKVFTRTPVGTDFVHWIEEERERKPIWVVEMKKKKTRIRKGKYYEKKKKWCKKRSRSGRSTPSEMPTETEESESERPKVSILKKDDDSSSDEDLPNRSVNKTQQEIKTVKDATPTDQVEEHTPETRYEESVPENPEGGFTPADRGGITGDGKQVGFSHDDGHRKSIQWDQHIQSDADSPELSKSLERVCPSKLKYLDKHKNGQPLCKHEIRILQRRLKLNMLNGRMESEGHGDKEEDMTDAMFGDTRMEKKPSVSCLRRSKKKRRSKENLPERYPEMPKEKPTKAHRRKSFSRKTPKLPEILNEISVEEWLHRSTVPPFKSSQYDERVINKFPDFTVPNFRPTMFEDFYVKFQKAMDEFVVRKENVTTSFDFKHVSSVTFTRHAVFKKGF